MTDLSSAASIRGIQNRRRHTAWLERLVAGLARGFDAHARRVGRYDEIRRLNAKSDEELAKLGITRDRIPYHVFSDLFYL